MQEYTSRSSTDSVEQSYDITPVNINTFEAQILRLECRKCGNNKIAIKILQIFARTGKERNIAFSRVVDLSPLSVAFLNTYTRNLVLAWTGTNEKNEVAPCERLPDASRKKLALALTARRESLKGTEGKEAKRKQGSGRKSGRRALRGFIPFHLQFRAFSTRDAAGKSSRKNYKADWTWEESRIRVRADLLFWELLVFDNTIFALFLVI